MAPVQQPRKGSEGETRSLRGNSKNLPITEADTPPDPQSVERPEDKIDVDLRHRLTSEAAYRLYVERGYADGYDFDDWLKAEAAVDHRLMTSSSDRR